MTSQHNHWLSRTLALIAILALFSANVKESQAQTRLPPIPSTPQIELRAPVRSPDVVAAAPVRVRGRFLLDEGSSVGVLQIEVRMQSGFYIGSLSQLPGGPLPTRIQFEPSHEYQLTGRFTPNVAPKVVLSDLFPVAEEYHEDRIVWSAPITIGAEVDPAKLLIHGHLAGQVCDQDGACRPLSENWTAFTARFGGYAQSSVPPRVETPPLATSSVVQASATVDLSSPSLQPRPFPLSSISPAIPTLSPKPVLGAAAVANPGIWQSIQSTLGQSTLGKLVLAMVAGFILNLMPCVLPVIGLKVMSFAQQAGESRGRVLELNVAFVAGLLSVFMALAALAAFMGVGWGQQFQTPQFSIALAAIVFVFALSLFGIWEIPIPGFVGSGAAAQKSTEEGLTGAFFKGVLTTLLATPCSGPLIVPTMAWAMAQTKPMIFGIFFCIGFGMGLPYLLFALVPGLVNLLPKPGAWMETFKQLMGFILLATVVWLFNGMNEDYFVPTLALLFALWFGCWWIGRVSITASLGKKIMSYIVAAIVAGLVGMFVFSSGVEHQEFTRADLDAFRDNGTTVMVDFTADW